MGEERIYQTNRVRFELMKRLGYFPTESSEHHAEYSAHFIPHGEEMCQRFAVPLDEYLQRCDAIVGRFAQICDEARSEEPLDAVVPSHEYGSLIIDALETGTPTVVYGNLVNGGAISNLPPEAVVEGPTLVDRAGLQLTRIGALPPQLVGYMQPHITQQELFIRAAQQGRRDHIYQAAMLDPLTAAMVPTDDIVAMCDELIEAHGAALPPLTQQSLVPGSGRDFSPPVASVLRASWEQAKELSDRDYICEWRMLGPFPMTAEGLSLDRALACEAALIEGAGTTTPLEEWSWRSVGAVSKGQVPLGLTFAIQDEPAIVYAVYEWDDVHPREETISCSSSDAIRIWLDGVEILSVDGVRAFDRSCATDAVTVSLREGPHRLLVKLLHYEGPWSFGVRFPPPTA